MPLTYLVNLFKLIDCLFVRLVIDMYTVDKSIELEIYQDELIIRNNKVLCLENTQLILLCNRLVIMVSESNLILESNK